ncbi:LPXTG cell wall anchor domain-containing protein [Actinoplanes sp. CA-030573]|uniref:LPXTG cell wall anchor domain-containing protein n=1 Tax=Actinoplanes sp. CA-030573 TaxID=3239898 RepID=UPI003D92064A
MTKTLLFRAATVLVSALIGAGAVATSAEARTGDHDDNKCTVADFASSDLTFAEDGSAVGTFTLKDDAHCATDVTLVSYLAPRPDFAVPQYLFANRTARVDSGQKSGSLTVSVPKCNTQVDLFVGGEDTIINPLVENGDRYGARKLQYRNFGASDCVQPAVQAIPNCDGSTDISLSNNGELSGYPVTFEISYNGQKQSVTVGKGEATKEPIHIPADSGPITVSAKNLETQTITWSRPDTCLPTATGKNDCTTVTVTVSNPEKNVPAKADVTYGDTTKTVTVAAGASEDVTFPAGEATTAKVDFPDLKGVPALTVDIVKDECSSPSPSASASESPSSSPSPSASVSASTPPPASTTPAGAPSTTPVSSDSNLPKTGAAASTVAGGAALLLIIGGALFFLARRRKVKFTA